jgi:hypothetical protein
MLVALDLTSNIQQPQFRTSTSMVRLEVSVADAHGAVRGLNRDAFVVEDTGHRQSVQVEESADAPLDLVMIAQPMQSVAYTSMDQTSRVAAGLSAFLSNIQDGDRLGILLAGAPPTYLRPLEFGKPSFEIRALNEGNYAAPFDAIAAGLRLFAESDRRRALIAFTNAADFRSVISFGALAEMARRLGPAFVLVGTQVKVDEHVDVTASRSGGTSLGGVRGSVSGYVFPATLQLLARRTGGITVNLGSGSPSELIAQMFTWLRTRYVISYEPPPGKGWHPVSVKVDRRGAIVTAREGYFVD